LGFTNLRDPWEENYTKMPRFSCCDKGFPVSGWDLAMGFRDRQWQRRNQHFRGAMKNYLPWGLLTLVAFVAIGVYAMVNRYYI
jgi:hypothetical protein